MGYPWKKKFIQGKLKVFQGNPIVLRNFLQKYLEYFEVTLENFFEKKFQGKSLVLEKNHKYP